MSVPSDVVPVPASPAFQPTPFADAAFDAERHEEDARLSREINARRASVENPEMLRRLRGL